MRFHEPAELAADVLALPRPLLLALDVDGVLSPLVSHAREAQLTPGVLPALNGLAQVPDVSIAVVSGRSLDGLRQFDFDPTITVVGSHGAEVAGEPPPVLTPAQVERLEHLTWLVQRSVEDAGPGAWMEQKPTGVVLHVRQADAERGQTARDALIRTAADLDGVVVKPGSAVVELMARPADKGMAVTMLRDRHRATSVVFAGDDVTDEDGFRVLNDVDLGVKVGPGETAATRRLADSEAVRDWLDALASALT